MLDKLDNRSPQIERSIANSIVNFIKPDGCVCYLIGRAYGSSFYCINNYEVDVNLIKSTINIDGTIYDIADPKSLDEIKILLSDREKERHDRKTKKI